MLPYIPVIIVHKGRTCPGKAIEQEDVVVVTCEEPFDEATIALVDMSALLTKIELVKRSGREIPAGTIYAIKCKAVSKERLDNVYVMICEVEDRLTLEDMDPDTISDLSIPIRIGEIITRADERYISRL